ncbi:MAG: lipid IV(A) 3-deoxy-D-manno-octulosonic acid transferase, partial [Betaproteobacteria bacterium]
MMRRLYTLLLYLLLPYILFHLVWRSRRQPEYLRHLGERFGFYPTALAGPLIWLHAVSVGETRAAVPLIAQLEACYPHHRILLTHMTPTGRETGRQLFGERVLQCYLPYDFPFAVRRFLAHFRPQLGLLMETEIWFNLVEAGRSAGLPLLLVNARMSEKSARRYGWFASLSRASLQSLSAVAAQTGTDAERLRRLGAPEVQVTGNLKFDMPVPQGAVDLGKALRQRCGEARPVFLAASTREGEEALILQVLDSIGIPGLLTVIVPRHPQRFDAVADLLRQRGLEFQRRSEWGFAGLGGLSPGSPNPSVAAETRVLLGDSMGEMFAYYTACDIAFIGGSLLPLGGQNLIEAAALGKPILIGPHTFNFAEATEHAVQAGAARRVANADELAKMLEDLFRSP